MIPSAGITIPTLNVSNTVPMIMTGNKSNILRIALPLNKEKADKKSVTKLKKI